VSRAEIPGRTMFWLIITAILNKFQDSNEAGHRRCVLTRSLACVEAATIVQSGLSEHTPSGGGVRGMD
jgi:hypothetical protein